MLATMAGADDIQRVAAALDRSRDGDLRCLDEVRSVLRSVEASRQLEVFVERVGDLTAEELRELYAETFHGETSSDRRLLAGLVRTPTDAAEAGVAVAALGSLLERLEAERNPFAYVVRSLCCLLLLRVKSSQLEQGSR
jgi:nitrate reductase assembly molybdenum cofactor insertion protein NarJ